ncbi:MAG: WD40 repeat domain-containing protein, partial [Gammaproteobacteria bacterium]|nr:WD40 repeat domain-containing protein [Gammaproteobacteria bacterium]
SDVWEIEFYPDSSMFATASSDGRVRLWDTNTGEKITEPFAGVASDMRGVQIDANGLLIAGDEQGRLHFWDIAQQKLLASSLAHHNSQITDGAVQTQGDMLVTLGKDQVVRNWRKTDEKPYRELLQLKAGAYGLAASPDGQWIAVGDGEGAVSVVDTQTGKPRFAPLALSSSRIWAVDFSPDNALLAAADVNGAIGVWDQSGNEKSRRDNAHDGAISALMFHPDKNIIFSGGSDGQVMQWNTGSLESSGSAMGPHKGGVTKLQISPDGSRLAVADRAGTIKVWQSSTGELEKEWVADDNTIWSLAWSVDSKSLATAHADEVLKIWNVESGEVLQEMTPQPGGATDVAFLHDDMTLVSTSRDGTVRLWDRDLGVQLGTALGVKGAAQWQVAANKDAGWFVTTQADGSVKLWDLLDKTSICRRAAWDKDAQRRYLGEGENPVAC